MHTIREKKKLIARVRRIRGQLEAIERALEDEKGCSVVLQQIAGTRGAINGLVAELVEEHVRTHVIDAKTKANAAQREAAEELIDVVRTYLR
jgi:DNA-binding FrmR family transcriptional regulator